MKTIIIATLLAVSAYSVRLLLNGDQREDAWSTPQVADAFPNPTIRTL